MNCREYIIEFEERGTLSEPATLHLTVCAECLKTSERQTQIWLMIDGLKPVAAPSDFDFHVKAKIARTKPSDLRSSPRLFPILRYVLPLSVVVLLLGLFAFNSAYFSDGAATPQIAQNAFETSNVNVALPSDLLSVNRTAFVESEMEELTAEVQTANVSPSKDKSEPQFLAVNPTVKRKTKSPKTNVDNEIGGSRVISLSETIVRTPNGTDINANIADTQKISGRQASDEQILTFFGIETAMENGKRTVKELIGNKAGARSGVKVGDVVETIVNNNLTVSRGTEKLEITLQ